MKAALYTLVCVLVVATALSQIARADPINVVNTLHLATGLDYSNHVIKGEGTDGHWIVNTTKFGSGPGQAVFPDDQDWGGPWVPNSDFSDWIAFNPDNKFGNGDGTYTRTFDLTGFNLADVYMQGFWTVDDEGTLALNGNVIAFLSRGDSLIGPYDPWLILHPFFVPLGSSFFNQGINTLTITLSSSDYNTEGVRLEGTPEPTSLILLGTGVLGLAATLRRKLGGDKRPE